MIKRFPSLRPLVIFFILVTAVSIPARPFFRNRGIDEDLVLGGNVLLFLASLIAFLITARSLRSANPQAFVRAMYGSFMVKFFILVIAAFIYIMLAKKNVNKPGLAVCAGLYILYTVLETKALTRLLKKSKNA